MPRRDRAAVRSGGPQQPPERGNHGRQTALKTPWRPDANQVTHHEPEIEGACMNQYALQDVRVTAQMGAAHAAGVIEMGEGPFDPLAALAHQAAAPSAANPPAI